MFSVLPLGCPATSMSQNKGLVGLAPTVTVTYESELFSPSRIVKTSLIVERGRP